MKVLVFGASGATGRHLVEEALRRGHSVTAFVREASRLAITHPDLSRVVGDVMAPDSVRKVLRGHEAVLCALGTMPEGKDEKARRQPEVPVCSEGTKNILQAMHEAGCRRIVVESAASIGDSYAAGRFGAGLIVRTVLKSVMADKELQEAAVRTSPFDWTLIRPPRLSNGAATGSLQSGEKLAWNITSTATRADVAAFMVQIIDDRASYRKALTVKA